MKLSYTPFIRESIKPVVDYNGYQPKYSITDLKQTQNNSNTKDVESEEIPVVSDVIEIKESVQKPRFNNPLDFKNTLLPMYEDALKSKGLNPEFAKSLVAQDALESAWGKKPTGKYNFGGIKGKGTLMNTKEYINGQLISTKSNFRDFSSLKDYVNYKVSLLNNNRYKAFDGDISEFSSRVARGGYATSPNYKEALDRVIRSIKTGGIIKFGNGSAKDAKDWLHNWLNNRSEQFKQNIDAFSPLPFQSNKVKRDTHTKIDKALITIAPGAFQSDTLGAYFPRLHTIVVQSDNPEVMVHELTHSSKPEAQVDKIKKLKDLYGEAMYINKYKKPDEYRDDPAEIYSRLMEMRYKLNINPNHIFTDEDVKNLQNKLKIGERLTIPSDNGDVEIWYENEKVTHRDPIKPGMRSNEAYIDTFYKSEGAFDILNRYSTPFIKHLLNDVAKSKSQSIVSAKNGTRLNTYTKVSSIPDIQSDLYRNEAEESYTKLNDYWISSGGSNIDKNDFVDGFVKLRNYGFSNDYTKAILANWFQESKFKPNVENSSGAKYIPQFLGSRRTDYEQWMRQNNKKDGISTAADFLIDKYNKQNQFIKDTTNYNKNLKLIQESFANITGSDSYQYWLSGKGNYNQADIDRFKDWLKENNLEGFRFGYVSPLKGESDTFGNRRNLDVQTYPTGEKAVKDFHDWFERAGKDASMSSRINYFNIM